MTTDGIQALYAQLADANYQADAASARYTRRKRKLMAECGHDHASFRVVKRDDQEIGDHERAWAFHNANATRLAATLQAELLMVEHRLTHGRRTPRQPVAGLRDG